MKLQLRFLALLLAFCMVCAYAAPEKPVGEARQAAELSADGASSKFLSTGEDAVGDLLLQAMSLIGVAYRWGGTNPASGLDCSGFIQYVFKKSLKVNLPRTAAQMANAGRALEKSELAPGDLVFFNTLGPRNSHVGIYMGNGKFIHSPRAGKSVEVSNMNQSYWTSRYNGARRISRNASSLPEATVKTAAAEPSEKVAAATRRPAKRVVAEPERVEVKCRKGRRCVRVVEKPERRQQAEKPSRSKTRAAKAKVTKEKATASSRKKRTRG